MLVLARKIGQSIVIGNDIELLVIEVRGEQVRLGIEAPKAIPVNRKELLEQKRAQNAQASQTSQMGAGAIAGAIRS